MLKRMIVIVGMLAIAGGVMVLGTGEGRAASPDPLTTILAKLNDLMSSVNAQSGQLDGVSRSWDKKLASNDPGGPCPSNSSRFTCVLGGAAVRDNQTGLVWEREPTQDKVQWGLGGVHARWRCVETRTGGVTGWRLPSVNELMSLADPTQNEPALPPGHPFVGIHSAWGEGYWSSSLTNEEPTATAWIVGFFWATAGPQYIGVEANIWCVRGPASPAQY